MKDNSHIIDREASQRLDILKFLFMIMVVFIHSSAVPELPFDLEVPRYMEICKDIITNGVCAIAVPGFFFISGLLLFSKDFRWIENMKKKVRSILLPYFIINSFWILFFKIMQSNEITALYFSGDNYQITGIEGIIKAYCDPIPLYYPFWFLRELFILNILASMIRRIVDRLPILSIALLVFLSFDIIKVPFLVGNSSLYMFVLGYYAVKYRCKIRILKGAGIWYTGLIYLGLTVCRLCLNRHVPMFMLFYSLVGILFYYLLSGYIRKDIILRYSQFTFFIYAFHEFYEAMAKKVIMLLLPQYGIVQLLEYFLIPMIVLAGCIAAGTIMKRKIYKIYCLLCGGRIKYDSEKEID